MGLNGLNGLFSNSLILTREQTFRGREGNSLLVHAHYHALAYSLFFFQIPFSFLSFLFSVFPSIFHSPSYFFFSSVLPCSVAPCTVHSWGPFYDVCYDGFLLFYPLTTFVLVWMSFLDHPLVCRLPIHHHLPVLVVPHLIPIKKSLILFSCSPWDSHPDEGGHSLSLSPWRAPSDSNSSFPLLGGMLSQQDISPKRV